MLPSTLLDELFHYRFLQNLMPIPATNRWPIGSVASPFELINAATGKKLNWLNCFDRHTGVLLTFTRIFSEKQYCPLCYPHIVELNQQYEQFQQRGIEVLLITSTSPSQSLVVWQDLQLKMPLLSDPSCRIFRRYQVGQALGAPLPAQFLVDRSGQIKFRHLFSFIEPNASLERLFAAIDRHSGQATQVASAASV